VGCLIKRFRPAAVSLALAVNAKIPKRPHDPKVVEKLLNLCLIRALPITIKTAGVPSPRKLPTFLNGHGIAGRQFPSRQPGPKVILRTEGENRRSGVADVLPKACSGHDKVNQPIWTHWLALTNHQVEFLVTLSTPARGVSDGIPAEYGGDAKHIPCSVTPVSFSLNFRDKVRW
jgi:hypothetical protein